jgi:hypothetical protein
VRIPFVIYSPPCTAYVLIGPETKTVLIYPSPENVEEILFKDKADSCFYLDPQEIECPSTNENIMKIPVQI